MSDYLGNLVTRTLSQAAIVRPQLPSLFETSVASGQIRSEFEFEPETFSESPPNPQHAAAGASNQAPQQSRLGDLESTPITHRSEAPALSSPLLVSHRQSALGESPPASILATPQSVVRESGPITSQVSRPKGIPRTIGETEPAPEETVQRPASKPRESRSAAARAETKVEPVTPELRRNDSDVGQREGSSRRARTSEAPTSVSQLSTPDSQLKSPSLVRPAVTARKTRALEAVVPVIRSLPQFPPTPMPAPAPTINVTIGRVEIRATSPTLAPQRARPKSANVLSLEDYLRQRAKGGGR